MFFEYSTISQTFNSIQGEGNNIGKPSLFIRFSGCNLNCHFCDTKYSRSFEKEPLFDYEEYRTFPCVINNNNIIDYVNYIKEEILSKNKIYNVVYTGGEPLLYYGFIQYFNLNFFEKLGFKTWEIETNGVLIGDVFEKSNRKGLDGKNCQYNISPKMIEYEDEYNNKYTKSLLNYYLKDLNYVFKFVYEDEYKDKYIEFIKINNIDRDKIIFMPLTPEYDKITITQNKSGLKFEGEFRKNELNTLKFCLKEGYRYSPRIHVRLFSNDRNEKI